MIISRAPLRISFFGGGTDYPEYFLREGGAVLATAIDKYSYVTASPFLSRLFDYSIRISYRKVELARQLDEIEHGVYRECLKMCELDKDIELHAMADLPAFTGLGSSSAFTVSLLQALHGFKGQFLKPQELACQAIHIERQVLKENVGCQDQIMAAFGGFNLIEFKTEDDFVVSRVPLPRPRIEELQEHLFMVFSGIKRKANEVVAQQLKKVEVNRPIMRQIRGMVDKAYDLLTGPGSLCEFGQLLHSAWMAKRSLDASITNPEIDSIYERGREAGAWGGKLLGAGGGGFLLFLAPPEIRPRLRQSFPELQNLEVKLNAPGSQIVYS